MEILNTIFYFLIVIGILVFVHEFGHFAAARIMGMRAEVFAFGMGYRLFGYNRINGFTFGRLKKDIDLEDHTDYRICAFPIGGYVKIAGMIDESMDKNFINKEPQHWEFRSKPVWKRIIVITAGVIMNLILAFAIFYALSLFKGKNLTDTTVIGYVSKNSVASKYGLKSGDIIKTINGNQIKYWDDIQKKLLIDNLGENISIVYTRGNQNYTIDIPKGSIGLNDDTGFGIFPENVSSTISDVTPGSPADISGLKKGDVIVEFSNEKITHSQQLVDLIRSKANTEVDITWIRDGKEMNSKITPGPDSTIGIMRIQKYEGPIKVIHYNIITAVPVAINDMYYYGIEVFFKSVYKVIKGDIPFKKAIGGPVKIAQASAQSAEGGIFTFLGFVALLSMSLAVINILPFPALDGGHFMILIWEGIFRKPLSYKIQIALQNIGFILLLAFMLFVIYNDIISIK